MYSNDHTTFSAILNIRKRSMSFGFGLGDVLSAAQLALSVYNACKEAPAGFKALAEEVEAMYIVLQSIRKSISESETEIAVKRREELNRVSRGSLSVLKELQDLLNKYSSLGSSYRKTWDKLRWGDEKVDLLRSRIISNISLLTAFNTSLVK